jgi:hypothetical protein
MARRAMTSRDPRSGWKRLEDTLGAIKPGETVTVEALAEECGLACETIEEVLKAAVNAEWFERREHGCYARRGHTERTTFSAADGRATIVASAAPKPADPPTPSPRRRKTKP